MTLYNLVNTGQCCLLLQQRQPWARERLGVSRQDWSGPRETWGRWWDTAVPEFPPVFPHWQAAYRAEAEPARREEEEVQRTKPEVQWDGYLSEREMGHRWPSLEAPERSLQRHRSPFWLEGTPAGKGISPKLQEALGLYRTVYPKNRNIYSFTLNEKSSFSHKLITWHYLIQKSIPCIHCVIKKKNTPLDKLLSIYHSLSCLLSTTAEPLTAAILDCVWPHTASGRTAPPHHEHPLKAWNTPHVEPTNIPDQTKGTKTARGCAHKSIKPASVFTRIQTVY